MSNFTEETKVVFDEEAIEPVMDIVEATTEKSGVGVGRVVAIATGVVGVAALAVKAIKWGIGAWHEHQSKKELRKPDENRTIEPSEEDLAAVAAK